MCKNCYDLTIRLECIIWAIAEIVLCLAFIALLFGFEGTIGTYSFILLGALIFGSLAGFFLLLGAILRNRYLLLAWIVLICPVVVVVVVIYCIILNKRWNYIYNYDKARKTIGMFLVICWIVYLVYLSRLLTIEIKTGERQKRYPDCVGGHYPRAVLRERRRNFVE